MLMIQVSRKMIWHIYYKIEEKSDTRYSPDIFIPFWYEKSHKIEIGFS